MELIRDARQKCGFEQLSNFPEKTWLQALTPVGCKGENLKLHRKQATNAPPWGGKSLEQHSTQCSQTLPKFGHGGRFVGGEHNILKSFRANFYGKLCKTCHRIVGGFNHALKRFNEYGKIIT